MIRTVFLDAGGVLVNPNWERVSDIVARTGLHADPNVLRECEPFIKRLLDTPQYITASSDNDRFALCFRLVLERAGFVDLPTSVFEELHAYHARYNLWESLAPNVIETLAPLRKKYKLVIVSNAMER